MSEQKKWNIFFLLFENVEVLDFSGSFDVFSMANLPLPSSGDGDGLDQGEYFRLYTVSEEGGVVKALHGLKVVADYSFETCPNDEIDVLIIPGASNKVVTKFIAENPQVIAWLEERLGHVPVVASVCVGALILATAGGFDGLQCTTHHASLRLLEGILAERHADATVIPGARYVDNPDSANPRVLSSAGVSAGIDQAFYMLRYILSTDGVASATAGIMEYNETRNRVFG